MQDFDDDDEWDDDFRPVPHPDDRLWRHPAEVAAEARAAALASAETVEVPVLLSSPETIGAPPPRKRLVAVAAVSALLVGGSALLAGTLVQPNATTEQVTAAQPVSAQASSSSAGADASTSLSASNTLVAPSPTRNDDGIQPVVASLRSGGPHMQQRASVTELYDELSASLPRVQVVTDDGTSDGSGFFLTGSGHIATSAKLLRNSEYVIVWTEGNRRFPAEIIGTDTFSDVALLKIEPGPWTAAAVAEQATLHVGQPALTVDHAQNSMTIGQVSAPFGTLRTDSPPSSPRVLISQAALPGTAVVDQAGNIIAMGNGLTDERSGESLATPAWLIQRVALDMLVSGNSSHAWLGAEVVETGHRHGVMITEVRDNSPAHRARLQVDDVIEQVDGVEISSLESMLRTLYSHKPSDEIDLMIAREDSRRVVQVTLGSLYD